MAQINSSGQSVPHACVICAPTIELALSEAEKAKEGTAIGTTKKGIGPT